MAAFLWRLLGGLWRDSWLRTATTVVTFLAGEKQATAVASFTQRRAMSLRYRLGIPRLYREVTILVRQVMTLPGVAIFSHQLQIIDIVYLLVRPPGRLRKSLWI